MMHLNRFGVRLALALAVGALVVLAHEREQLMGLQILACAVLLVWAVLEIGNAYRQRSHVSGPRPR